MVNESHSTSQISSLALRLAEYNFEIKYKKGNKNENADALSRLPVTDENPTLGVIVNPPD